MPGPGPDHQTREGGHLPAWLVERLAFEPEAAPAQGAHVEGCERCRAAVEGLRRARQDRPSAIFLDLAMPDMDGRSVLREIRADPATSDIPVIAVLTRSGRVR